MDLARLKKRQEQLEQARSFTDPFQRKVIEDLDANGGGGSVVRMMGDYVEARRAWIVCDDEKTRPFIIIKESILQDILQKMQEGERETDRKGQSYKKYTHAKTQAFALVMHNGSDNERDRGWRPSNTFLFNAIDRQSVWCPTKKHTMLLVKTKNDIGIGSNALSNFSEMTAKSGDPDGLEKRSNYGYDVRFGRTGKGIETEYPVEKAVGEFVVNGATTEEERAYERYDLSEVATPTDDVAVYEHLKKQIQLIDEEMGTDFLARLEGSVKEKPVSRIEEMRAKLKQETIEGEEEAPASRPVDVDEVSGHEEDSSKITVVRRKLILPKKGEVKEEPCEACKKPFPITDTKCPHCGAEYAVSP